jgi:hypothetical protein
MLLQPLLDACSLTHAAERATMPTTNSPQLWIGVIARKRCRIASIHNFIYAYLQMTFKPSRMCLRACFLLALRLAMQSHSTDDRKKLLPLCGQLLRLVNTDVRYRTVSSPAIEFENGILLHCRVSTANTLCKGVRAPSFLARGRRCTGSSGHLEPCQTQCNVLSRPCDPKFMKM